MKGWNFPVEVDKTTGKIKLSEDDENVKQGIKIVLGTQPGERRMRLAFGTDTNRFVFESINLEFVNDLANEVGRSLNKWVHNIQDLRVVAQQSNQNKSLVRVKVDYLTNFSDEMQGFAQILDQSDAYM